MLTSLIATVVAGVSMGQSANGWQETTDRVAPAVVVLRVSAPRAFDGTQAGYSMATGFVVDAQRGLILTNRHVVMSGPVTAEAVFLDNGYLTDVRTAAAGAVAARHLARADAARVAIFGAGVQAQLQLKALTLVRPIATAVVWARDAAKAGVVAGYLSRDLGLPVAPEPDPARAVAGADIVVTTTPSPRPILRADWPEPGQHGPAIGSDPEHQNEITPPALARADLHAF